MLPPLSSESMIVSVTASRQRSANCNPVGHASSHGTVTKGEAVGAVVDGEPLDGAGDGLGVGVNVGMYVGVGVGTTVGLSVGALPEQMIDVTDWSSSGSNGMIDTASTDTEPYVLRSVSTENPR